MAVQPKSGLLFDVNQGTGGLLFVIGELAPVIGSNISGGIGFNPDAKIPQIFWGFLYLPFFSHLLTRTTPTIAPYRKYQRPWNNSATLPISDLTSLRMGLCAFPQPHGYCPRNR